MVAAIAILYESIRNWIAGLQLEHLAGVYCESSSRSPSSAAKSFRHSSSGSSLYPSWVYYPV